MCRNPASHPVAIVRSCLQPGRRKREMLLLLLLLLLIRCLHSDQRPASVHKVSWPMASGLNPKPPQDRLVSPAGGWQIRT